MLACVSHWCVLVVREKCGGTSKKFVRRGDRWLYGFGDEFLKRVLEIVCRKIERCKPYVEWTLCRAAWWVEEVREKFYEGENKRDGRPKLNKSGAKADFICLVRRWGEKLVETRKKEREKTRGLFFSISLGGIRFCRDTLWLLGKRNPSQVRIAITVLLWYYPKNSLDSPLGIFTWLTLETTISLAKWVSRITNTV